MSKIKLLKEDITKMKTDAIVNAANESLQGGGGVDGAIHRAAGPELPEATKKIGGCPTGEARITKGFKLPAQYIIHTVGPVWRGGGKGEEILLASAYRESMALAEKHRLSSIAFPNISTGVYGFPKGKAAKIAVDTVRDYMANHNYPEKVYFVCFDDENYDIYQKLL
ncbi:MAG: O-acetyl-ADP-ribose deacetylase [Bacteroidales bacterium]